MSTNQKKRVNNYQGEAMGKIWRIYPMKKIFACLTILVILTATTTAQNFVPSIVRLRDDATPGHICLVKADGSYLILLGADELRIESFAPIQIKGNYLSFQETTDRYRVVVVADLSNGTGKVIVTYTGVGQRMILDRTRD